MKFFQNKSCSNCGESFTCGPESGEHCWCEHLPHISLIAGEDQDCFCPRCLSEAIQKSERASTLPDKHVQPLTERSQDSQCLPVEGEDYYLEGGALVFTARYHLRRGYCCENRCRHCPYG